MACPAGPLRRALEATSVIPWYRGNAFQLVSLRLILEGILRLDLAAQVSLERIFVTSQIDQVPLRIAKLPPATARPPPTDPTHEKADAADADAASSRGDLWRSLTPPTGSARVHRGRAFHLYASPYNPGADGIARLLQAEVSEAATGSVALKHMERENLRVTLEPSQRPHATHFLLYLHRETHTNATLLHAELECALREHQKIVLVHEQRPNGGAVPFSYFLNETHMVTPVHLIQPRATLAQAPSRGPVKGIYSEIAVPLYDGEYLKTSLRLTLLRASLAKHARSHSVVAYTDALRHPWNRSQKIARLFRSLVAQRRATILDGGEDDSGRPTEDVDAAWSKTAEPEGHGDEHSRTQEREAQMGGTREDQQPMLSEASLRARGSSQRKSLGDHLKTMLRSAHSSRPKHLQELSDFASLAGSSPEAVTREGSVVVMDKV